MEDKQIYEHKIQYYETDQMKIVHHSNYIRWFEEARVFWLETIDCGYDKLEALGIISPVLGVTAEYKSMSRFGETVQIETELVSYNGIKFAISYTIKDRATGVIRCVGQSTHCFLDQEGRPISLKRSHPDIHDIFVKMNNTD